ncbi:MAG: carboxypeptidase regulatory-like domain-containing protein, partial [Gemmatimonadota bacterium]|nr:carboxypeptidase regulatory-like domain-containing protein [Gemmatimonadota bacterium]
MDRITRVPLPDADVEVTVDGRLFATRSNARGRFRFCGIPAGQSAILNAEYRSVASRSVPVMGGNAGRPVGLEVNLGEPAEVSVLVTAADTDQPIEDVTVRLDPSVIGGVTNAEGRVSLGRIPPGEYRLRADHLAFHGGEGDVFVVPGSTRRLDVSLRRRILALDTLDVMIEAGECARPGYTTVSGKVIDEDTELPLEGAIVSASRFDEGTLFEQRTQTAEDGTFVLCGLEEDRRFRLFARVGELESEDLSVRPGRERGAIVLEVDHGDPAIVALRVVDDATGEPVRGAMVRLDPHPLGGITNERGRVGFRTIPPGDYAVRVEHIAYASYESSMTVEDRSAEEYEVRLRPTAIAVEPLEVTITGRDPVLLG